MKMDSALENLSIFLTVIYSSEPLFENIKVKLKKLHHSPSDIPLAMRLQSDFLEVKGRKTI